jgi:hypothetical protein
MGQRYDQCRNEKVLSGRRSRRYCEDERTALYDGRYIMCGKEGRLWEPRPPTQFEKILEAVRTAFRGPRTAQDAPKGRGLMEVLREAVRGPGASDGGKKVA